MAVYFANLERPKLVSDALKYTIATALSSEAAAGSTTITVDDASGFSVGDNIDISTETSTISEINGNDITLESGLSADHHEGDIVGKVENGVLELDLVNFSTEDTLLINGESYQVDSISGTSVVLSSQLLSDVPSGTYISIDDADKDGLTPETAKRSTIFIDGDSVNEPSTVWVKRNSTFELSENTDGATWSKIIFWPKEGEEYYDTRPQEGIDAGWDDENGESKILFNTYYINHNQTEDARIYYINVDLMHSDVADSIPMFYKKGGDMDFVNCTIENNRTHNRYGGIIRGQHDGSRTITFRGCHIESPDAAIYGEYDSEDINHYRHVILDNTYFSGYAVFSKYCTNDYIYQNTRKSTIINNSFVSVYNVIRGSAYRSYINGFDEFYFRDSTILASNRILSNNSTDQYYGMSPVKIDIDNCTIESKNEMFYLYHRNNNGYDYVCYEDWKITNSSITCGGNLFHLYANERLLKQYGKFIIEDCEVNINWTALYCDDIDAIGPIIFRNNNIVNLDSLVYVEILQEDVSIIHIRDAVISDYLVSGGGKYNIDLRNVLINGSLSGENDIASEDDLIFIDNVKCGRIWTTGKVNATNSIISSLSDDALKYQGGSIFRNCEILTSGTDVLTGSNSSASFVDCTFDCNIDTNYSSSIEAFNCNVDGEFYPYYSRDHLTRKKMTPVYRVGGHDGALLVKQGYYNGITNISLTDINGVFEENSTKISLYASTNAQIDTLSDRSKFTIDLYYTDADGVSHKVEGVASIDTQSEWNGVPDTYANIKFTFDMITASTIIGDDRNVSIDMLYFPKEYDENISFYVDIDLVSEN